MVLMSFLGALLLVGVTLTLWWGGTEYVTWRPGSVDDHDHRDTAPPPGPSVRTSALHYLRGVAVALVGGFWAGALVTGPAVRLIMRLLAVTGGDGAQGRLTEADEVIGRIDLGGTIGLYVFGGLLPGLLSGAIYVVFRPWLPRGRAGGVAFGALHLVVAATRIDPLRPDNPDFDLVGPGWLAVATFALASLLHGMAVVAIANRYTTTFPSAAGDRARRRRALLPLVLPALLLVPGVFLVIPILVGLAVTVAATRIGPVVEAARSRRAILVGRTVVVLVAVALLPGAVADLRDVVVRDDAVAVPVDGGG